MGSPFMLGICQTLSKHFPTATWLMTMRKRQLPWMHQTFFFYLLSQNHAKSSGRQMSPCVTWATWGSLKRDHEKNIHFKAAVISHTWLLSTWNKASCFKNVTFMFCLVTTTLTSKLKQLNTKTILMWSFFLYWVKPFFFPINFSICFTSLLVGCYKI